MSNKGFCSRDFAPIPAKGLKSFKKNILSHSHSTKELHCLHSTIGPCPKKKKKKNYRSLEFNHVVCWSFVFLAELQSDLVDTQDYCNKESMGKNSSNYQKVSSEFE